MNLGKFHIIEEVGHGGFGTVYRANDTSLDRTVALKILHQQYLSDQKFIQSFKREARLMAKVSHPNVVQIFEIGDLESQIYIAMQYFDGGNLDQKIQAGGPLPLRDAIRMLSQTAHGLEAGHKIGLVHRDVKPANILYNRDGYIAISDFGVAKSIQQSSPETTNSYNQFAGTPYYIPPELWKSEGSPSPAADVYSLACVFYEVLTGEILFAGDTYEHVLTRHVLEAPTFSDSFPESLVETLTVALAKNPSDRYQTMNDFLAGVRRALESHPRKSTGTRTPAEQSSLVEGLPKPLAPGEITFDELVRRSQYKSAPQSSSPKPETFSQPGPAPEKPAIRKGTPEVQKTEPESESEAEAPAVIPIIRPPQVEEQPPQPITAEKPASETHETEPGVNLPEIALEQSAQLKTEGFSEEERIEDFFAQTSDTPLETEDLDLLEAEATPPTEDQVGELIPEDWLTKEPAEEPPELAEASTPGETEDTPQALEEEPAAVEESVAQESEAAVLDAAEQVPVEDVFSEKIDETPAVSEQIISFETQSEEDQTEPEGKPFAIPAQPSQEQVELTEDVVLEDPLKDAAIAAASVSQMAKAENERENELALGTTLEKPRVERRIKPAEDKLTQTLKERESLLAHDVAASKFDQSQKTESVSNAKKKNKFIPLIAFGGVFLIALAFLVFSGQARSFFASLFSDQSKAPAILPTHTSTSTEALIVMETPVVEEPTEAPTSLTVVTFFDQLQNLSPFFNSIGAEKDIINLTQLSLLTTDRQGMVVENAIAGETRSFNGTPYTYTGPADVEIDFNTSTGNTLYTFTLRPDLKFSDGVPVSADDLIFTLYTFLDPSFDGQNDIAYLPVLGLQDYRTQTTPEIYEKYRKLFASIHDSGKDHVWGSSDPWTQNQQEDVLVRLEEALAIEVEKIVDYIVSNYTDDYTEEFLGFSPEEVYANEGLQVAFSMRSWGFAEENTTTKLLTGKCSGKTWDLNYEYPTQSDYAEEIRLCYNDDYRAAFPYESPDGTDVYQEVEQDFINYWGPLDPNIVGGVPNIRGVRKISDTSLTVELEGFATNWIYSLDIPITPLHHYGNTDKYNYALNMFGFDFGDLSLQHSKDFIPMGAGPYQPDLNFNYLEANRYYYKGEPKIDQIAFVEGHGQSLPGAISLGSLDLAEFSNLPFGLEEIYNLNSNDELTGDVITTSRVENLGYGYIGINARMVKVGDDPSSTASRYLRKALSTILAVHRKPAIESYYGPDSASIQEYPIIPSSWASPQPGDPDYQEAFSMDVNGETIYTQGMSQEQRVAAAQQAALGFFEAAGFTISGDKIRVAPVGAMLEYECIILGQGTGDHPAYGLLVAAQETLSEIGIILTINDPTDSNVLWEAIDNGTQELWAASWYSAIDPDLYQAYHSFNTFH